MKVIKLTNNNGYPEPKPGNDSNTLFGSGQPLVANRVVPYEIRKAPKVNVSLIKKYHIIILPYSTLKGLLPPPHSLVGGADTVVVVAIIIVKVSFANLLADY